MVPNARARLCAACVLICLTSLACSRLKLAGKQAGRAFKESSRDGLLLKRAQEHNAILNWKASFAKKKRPLTADFQRALVRFDGHPTAFEAKPLDAFLQSDRLYLLASVSSSPRKLNVVLEIPETLLEQVWKLDLIDKQDRIVLADIESVDRPLPGIPEPETLVAHGKCIALYDFEEAKPPEAPSASTEPPSRAPVAPLPAKPPEATNKLPEPQNKK